MAAEHGTIENDFTVSGTLDLYGLAFGSIRVPSGATLNHYGLIANQLVVESGGVAIVRGTVRGAVFNHGGKVELYGTVGSVRGDGPTFVAPEAVVRERSKPQ